MEICLIRHTTPEVEAGICYGQTDLSLAETYPVELQKVRSQISGVFDQIYSSPLKRCAQLAKDLFGEESIHFEDRIKEFDFGEWEMVPWNQMDRELQEKWKANFIDIPAPGGENLMEMHDRIQAFIKDLNKKQYSRVALVTHSGVMRIISAIVEQTDLAKCFDYKLSYGTVKSVKIN